MLGIFMLTTIAISLHKCYLNVGAQRNMNTLRTDPRSRATGLEFVGKR